MNISEANEVNKLLRWILRTPTGNDPAHADQRNQRALEAAEYLANRAERALHAGLGAADVRAHWPADRPATTAPTNGETE